MSFKDSKGTEWQFAAIPLGGFVKFSGDDNLTSINTHTVVKSDASYAQRFNEAPVLSRFFTVLAGPFANFIFSIFIFSLIILLQGVSVSDPVIGKINKFYEAKFDIQVNDKVLEIDGQKVVHFLKFFL